MYTFLSSLFPCTLVGASAKTQITAKHPSSIRAITSLVLKLVAAAYWFSCSSWQVGVFLSLRLSLIFVTRETVCSSTPIVFWQRSACWLLVTVCFGLMRCVRQQVPVPYRIDHTVRKICLRGSKRPDQSCERYFHRVRDRTKIMIHDA